MRRQYFYWMYLVIAILLTVYGGYLLIYHIDHGNGVKVLFIVMLSIGILMFILYGALYIYDYKKNKNKKIEEPVKEEIIEVKPEPVKEEVKEEPVQEKEVQHVSKKSDFRDDTEYVRTRVSYASRGYDASGYVKLVGSGPVLRVDGNRIYDMRNGDYYRIEGNVVKIEGSGPVFEINGNRIRNAFGGYLYEISGSNINKVYGGYYASISGNYITTYDLKYKYEITDSFAKGQLLAIVAILFGNY